jgi:hypothetical protein
MATITIQTIGMYPRQESIPTNRTFGAGVIETRLHQPWARASWPWKVQLGHATDLDTLMPTRYSRDIDIACILNRIMSRSMSNVTGIVLILAGVSIGTYALLSGKDTGARASPPLNLADTRASVPAEVHEDFRPTVAPANWSTSQATVADPPMPVRIAEVRQRVPLAQYTSSSEPPPDHLTLIRDIQRHLKRVGCYQDEITGVWSASVTRSMKAFIDHVNAALPVEQPDLILLALLQNQRDRACDVPCPPGQALIDNGRCLPTAVIGKARTKAPTDTGSMRPTIASTQAIVLTHAGRPPPNGRMLLGGPASSSTSTGYKAGRNAVVERPTHRAARARQGWPQAAPRGRGRSRYPTWAARAFNLAY